MHQKIIPFNKARKKLQDKNLKKSKKMLFLTIIAAAVIGMVLWDYFVEKVAYLDVKILESKNIVFNDTSPIPMTTTQVVNEFEKAEGKPVLLYLYTTWCKICTENFPAINEIAREFQNTELQFIALAIDRDLEPQAFQDYFNKFGDVYFPLRYLAFKEGFSEFLLKRNIRYNRVIPFTVLISRHGEVITKFSGKKNKNYLRNKIIKELYGN